MHGGFFAQAGVKVTSIASNRGSNLAALQSASVDIELGDPAEAINARTQGLKIRTIGQTVSRFASHVVVRSDLMAKAGITEATPVAQKIAVLRGLSLGNTGPGGSTDNMLRWMAVKGGMDPNRDMRLVSIQGGGPGMIAALTRGVIDGFCLSSPTSDIAVSTFGCSYFFQMVLNPPAEFARYTSIVCSAAEKALVERREPLVRYVMGIALALQSIQHDQPAFKAFVVPFLELDIGFADQAFDGHARMYYPDPRPTEPQFATSRMFVNTINANSGLDPVPDRITFASVFDTTVAAAAMARIGVVGK